MVDAVAYTSWEAYKKRKSEIFTTSVRGY
ncbi:hypothetical protein P9D47_03020 [Bacillus haynesii]|nr:hypothetical protein [Bacillus haynesii]MCY7778353.1 hypothetical protein [Bacillus haynesii]MCY8669733.1 hypothetical protein [Bacillus haynesii]MEC0669303.1 hypothetical protein [Bacillus haynesii]MEC1416952.1 hypothetical protein [Bacillus haynesii]MEC1467023.1 hypothetical protein [Bacillus haynesii]